LEEIVGGEASALAPALPVIECRHLEKWYGGVHALHDVSLSLHAGESVGLVGDNGAGKSTLIKILSGVHRPDAGEVLIDGRVADIANPRAAMRLGIETIYQNNSMVPAMSSRAISSSGASRRSGRCSASGR
jgi:simple sugar transport system ATP-binding protein